jgi:hypothetical protein
LCVTTTGWVGALGVLAGAEVTWLTVLTAAGELTGVAGAGVAALCGAGGLGGFLRSGTPVAPASPVTAARAAGTETAGASEVTAGADELERVTAPIANAAANARAVIAISAI